MQNKKEIKIFKNTINKSEFFKNIKTVDKSIGVSCCLLNQHFVTKEFVKNINGKDFAIKIMNDFVNDFEDQIELIKKEIKDIKNI